ncbi:hypothetical protein B0O80DRAFT_487720 [Mortierella sp. GBAus27b]|nr:hypothetical protein B0O80DRAFT_487720 [Mortierella sp. GBAus27b]
MDYKFLILLGYCFHTVIAGGMSATTGSGSNVEQANMLAATCVTELCTFLEDQQNLEYIGLSALTKILTHPHLVGEHKDIILKCINDPDISIADKRLTEPENPENANSMVLLAAAWLTGEYSYGSYGWDGEGSPAGGSKKKIKKGGDQGDSKEGSDARSKYMKQCMGVAMKTFVETESLWLSHSGYHSRKQKDENARSMICTTSEVTGSSPKSQKKGQDDLDVDEIPIVQLGVDGFQQSIVFSKEAKSGSRKKRRGRS